MVSITFQNPEILWFLAAIPLLIVTHFFLLRNAKRKALKFANFAVIKRATGEKFITKNYTILVLRLFVILFAILAVSGAEIWYEGTTNENEYVIAIDTSASMSAQDVQPTRLDAAKEEAKVFIDRLDRNTRVGLVSFSGVTLIEQALTSDRSDLYASLDDLDFSASGTDIPGAIITSTNLLTTSDRGRAIILITDGSNTIETFRSKSVQRAMTYAVINRVKVYAIGIGTEDSGPIGYLPTYYNITAGYNQETLDALANATGGKSYSTSDPEAIAQAYADVTASDKTARLSLNLTPGLMVLTLMFIMIEWGLINTRFRSLP